MLVRISARVAPEVADAFDRLRTETGATFTALVQALGEQLAAGDRSWLSDAVVRRARAIDRERGSRR